MTRRAWSALHWTLEGVAWLPVALIALAAALALLRTLGWAEELSGLARLSIPLEAASGNRLVAACTALTFGATAFGLWRGKRLSWWLAVLIFSVALVTQVLLGHPIGVGVATSALTLLVADRGRYGVQSAPAWRRRFLGIAIVAGLAIVGETALVITLTGDWPRPLAALGDATAALAYWLGVSDELSNRLFAAAGPATLVGVVLLAIRLPLALAALGVLSAVPERPADSTLREHAKQILARHGAGALLPFQSGDDKLVFAPDGSDGLVVYGRAGRIAVALGDPIGPPAEAARALVAFVDACRQTDRVPVVYQASGAGRATLQAAGFRHLYRVGEEAVVDLHGFSLAGSRRANLRHTVTRCRRGGVTVQWFADGLRGSETAALRREIVEIDRAWCARNGPELGFTISRFTVPMLRRQPVAVALGPDGRATAFATFRPTGRDGGWVLDLIRRSPGGVPGAVESCLVAACEAFAAAGAPRLSLGLAPLGGLRRDAGPIEERLLAIAASLVRPWYDVRGLAFFKAKFDPRWEPRYAAVQHRADSIGLCLGLVRLHLRGSNTTVRRLLARA